MTLQVAASPTIVILTDLESSFTLLENIYSTSITYDHRHLRLLYFYSTDHRLGLVSFGAIINLLFQCQISNLGCSNFFALTEVEISLNFKLPVNFLLEEPSHKILIK